MNTEPTTSDLCGNPISVIVWWTPDCGHLHVETDPPYIYSECPDGKDPYEDPEATDDH